MTNKNLIDKLSNYPEDAEIVISMDDLKNPDAFWRVFGNDIHDIILYAEQNELLIIVNGESNDIRKNH